MFNYLLFLSAYLPFQLALNPASGVDLASIRVFILILFFVWLAESARKKSIILRADGQTFLIGTFLFLSFLSLFFAQNWAWSARKLLYLFSVFPLYFVLSSLAFDLDKIKKIIKTLVVSGSFVAGLGIIQFFLQFAAGLDRVYKFWSDYVALPFLGKSFGASVLENSSWLVNISGHTYLRATATFPDPHMFSFFLGILLPLALGLGISSKKGLWYFLAFLIFLADILTFSRGGYLGLAAGALVLVFLFWRRVSGKQRIFIFSVILAVGFLLIVSGPVSSRFFSSFNLKEGSNSGRLEMWGKAMVVIRDNPLIGTGLGNYPLAVDPLAAYRDPIYAHNTYLDIAVETGIPASLSWIFLLIAVIYSFWKKAKKDILYAGAAVSLIIFLAHSLVETGIYSPVVLALVLIIIGINKPRQNEKMA